MSVYILLFVSTVFSGTSNAVVQLTDRLGSLRHVYDAHYTLALDERNSHEFQGDTNRFTRSETFYDISQHEIYALPPDMRAFIVWRLNTPISTFELDVYCWNGDRVLWNEEEFNGIAVYVSDGRAIEGEGNDVNKIRVTASRMVNTKSDSSWTMWRLEYTAPINETLFLVKVVFPNTTPFWSPQIGEFRVTPRPRVSTSEPAAFMNSKRAILHEAFKEESRLDIDYWLPHSADSIGYVDIMHENDDHSYMPAWSLHSNHHCFEPVFPSHIQHQSVEYYYLSMYNVVMLIAIIFPIIWIALKYGRSILLRQMCRRNQKIL